MNEALEAELRKTRVTIYAIVASFQEPSTSGKILREYTEEYGGLTHEKFGYQHLEKLLDDHPKLFATIDSQGRRAYKAKVSDNAAAQDLQYQIQRQKKKKKKSNRGHSGYNKATRGGDARIFTNGSLKSRLTFGRLVAEERQQSYLRGRGITRGTPKTSQRGRHIQPPTLHNPSPRQAAPPTPLAHWLKPQKFLNTLNGTSSLFQSLSQPSLMKTTMGQQQRVPEIVEGSATEGARKIMEILNAVGGTDRLTKFAQRYRERHGSDFDQKELAKYFGIGKLSSVLAAMKDQIVFEVLDSDETLIRTKASVERTQKDYEREKDKVEVVAPRAIMTPRLTELMEHFTMQLVNMYPNPIPLSDVGIFYSRHYGAEVNPERLYAKSWSNLFATTFSSRTMVKDGCIHLSEAYVKKHNIKPKHTDQSHARADNNLKNQLAIINDLHESSLESGDESQEEEECEETIAETDISLTSIPLECRVERLFERGFERRVGRPMDLSAMPPSQEPAPVLQTQRSSTINSFLKFKCMERGQPKQKTTVEVASPRVNISETPEPPKANAQDSPSRVKVVDRIRKPDPIKKEPENQRPETPVMPTVQQHKVFNTRYFVRIGSAKNPSTQPQKKTEPKPKETPKKAEKNQTKKPVQVVVDQELSNMASCFASLAVTPTKAPSAPKLTVQAKPKEKKGATVKFDPIDDVKRRCAAKMALMAEMKPEGTIRTHTSFAASVLPQRTRRPVLLSKVTQKGYP